MWSLCLDLLYKLQIFLHLLLQTITIIIINQQMKVFSEWHQDFTTDPHQHHQYIKRKSVSSAKNYFF